MTGKIADIVVEDFNKIIEDGNYLAEEGGRVYGLRGDKYIVVIRYTIYDKFDHLIGRADVWSWTTKPPAGTTVIVLSENALQGAEDVPNGQIAQVDIVGANDDEVRGSLSGLNVNPTEFLSSLAKGVPSDERYAYWVSLFDGDLTVAGSKEDDHGIEVGAGGTAVVNAGKGNDLLHVWHTKNVVFNGGKGIDTLDFGVSIGSTPDAPTGATVNLTTGTGTNPFGGTLTLAGVENVAGVFDKANTLIGNGKANQLIAGHEADTIKGEGGDDSITIAENNGFGPRALNVDGGAGNDTLFAYLSSVADFTGSGSTLRHGNVLDLLNPANNTGTFAGGTFAGLETYRASGFLPYYALDFRGSNNGETAIGISGADNLQGRGGNDTLRGSDGADTIDGGDGRDVADYSDNNFAKIVAKINGAATTITVNGVQQDILISIEGAKGGGGADKLTGDGGANELDGGLGKDALTGKGGKDHFAFSTELFFDNIDTIKDFKHGKDKIDLDDAIFAALGPSVSSGEFLKVSSGHAAKQKDDHLIYNSKDGSLWYDDDGSGKHAAIKFAVLTGSPDNLSHQDFAIV